MTQAGHHQAAFILSCERSGSTLLRYLLDTHSQVTSPGELLLGKLCEQLYMVHARTTMRLLGPMEDRELFANTTERVRQDIDAIMGPYADARKKRVWCEKSPGNLEYLSAISSTFPDAKYVCLYRNAFDVAQSCLESSRLGFMAELVSYAKRYPGNLVRAMLLSWADKTEQILAFQHRYPEQCFQIHYEQLVLRPEEVLPPLFSFLGVDREPTVLTDAFKVHHEAGGGDTNILGWDAIQPSRVGRGRDLPVDRVPPRERERLNSLLRNLDYAEV